MFGIAKNGIICVARGDYFEIPVVLQTGNPLDPRDYIFREDDTLYLGIMEPNQLFENAIVRKKLTFSDVEQSGYTTFTFSPEETQCLLPGKYYYQVKLRNTDILTNKPVVETVVPKTLIYIQE